MLTIYFLVGILYLLLLGRLRTFWKPSQKPIQLERPSEMISIIIPFRNEAENLPDVLKSVLALSFRPLQVVFVNDSSEDDSVDVLSKLLADVQEESISFEILHAHGTGKKAALQTGIQHASGGIVLTTDADCHLPSAWVEMMCAPFTSDRIQLTAGPVISKGQNGFLEKFQQVEWASVLLVTQASFALNMPLMCSGANLAFRKSAFVQVDGYKGNEHLLSGDDEFLLKKVVRYFGSDAAIYVKEEDALVKTQSQASWASLFSQKVRWASKWKLHQSTVHLLSSLLPAMLQFFFLISIVLLGQGTLGVMTFCVLWSIKIFSEYWNLSLVLNSYRIRHATWVFVVTSLIHPIYVIRVVLGALFGKFVWKGRNSLDKP